jgi:two-component system sensor histidine kinase LytS
VYILILTLSFYLIERLGLIILFAFFISKTIFFKRYVVKKKVNPSETVMFAVFWGILGIVMTKLGTPVSGGIVNSRTIPIVLSGLLGGPLSGLISGVIAGYHRAFLTVGGELTAISCGISTVIGGLIGGYSKKYFDNYRYNHTWVIGIIVGLLTEVIQMIIILTIAKPFEEALTLVELIFIPMTFLNSIGIGLFLLFIQQIFNDYERVGAAKAQVALDIANQTLPHFRKGLNEKSAQIAAEIIRKLTLYDAVAITDTKSVLIHVGSGSDHHKSGDKILTDITKEAIETASIQMANKKKTIGCDNLKCPLRCAIVAPIKISDNVIGVLKVYKEEENSIGESDIELIRGLGNLFSTQLELANIEKQKKLTREAELKALRAQIKPHFLFNSLNAIMSITRTDPNEARRLLQELSVFLRNSFKESAAFVPLREEIRLIEAYLNIEKARFPDKLFIHYDVDDIDGLVPPLIFQPIVENAVKHGIGSKSDVGTVYISIKESKSQIYFKVKDDGVGMDSVRIDKINSGSSSGVGLINVKKRLKSIYGVDLKIKSELGMGTEISFVIPKKV